MKDNFAVWLEEHRDSVALKDKSYKNKYSREKHKSYEGEVNTELATVGDAVLRLVLCELLWKKEEKLSEEKQKYEADRVLVTHIASHYKILGYLQYDKKNDELKTDYDCIDAEGKCKKNCRKHKFIATAVEACLGAIYLENKKRLGTVRKIVKKWKKIIDKNKRK